MSGFQDQSIDEGVRKRTAYQNDRRARLALNVERQDGGILQIPVASDMLGRRGARAYPAEHLPGCDAAGPPTLGKAGYGDQLPAGARYRGRDGSTCSRTASCGANWNVMARNGNLFEVDLLRGAAGVRTSVRP